MPRVQVLRVYGLIGAVVGLFGIWRIGGVAPPQPEYMYRAGSCENALCGTLEDP